MAKILFTNGAQTVLNGAITSSATTLAVVSLTGFPSSLAVGEFFYIAIEDELIKVTAMSGTTWTAVRGVDGTTGAAHADVTIVTGILNKEAMDYLRDSITAGGGGGGSSVTYGPIASRPAAGTAGNVYVPSDSYYDSLYDNGSAWIYRSMDGHTCTPPASGSFTAVNSPTVSVQTNGGIVVSTAPAAGDNIRSYVIAAPATPWTKIFRLAPLFAARNFNSCGVVLRQSSSSKLTVFAAATGDASHANSLSILRYSNNTTFSATNVDWPYGSIVLFGRVIFRVGDTGTNITFEYSTDGINFLQVYSESRTAYFTTTGPDQVGMYVNSNNAAYGVTCVLIAMD